MSSSSYSTFLLPGFFMLHSFTSEDFISMKLLHQSYSPSQFMIHSSSEYFSSTSLERSMYIHVCFGMKILLVDLTRRDLYFLFTPIHIPSVTCKRFLWSHLLRLLCPFHTGFVTNRSQFKGTCITFPTASICETDCITVLSGTARPFFDPCHDGRRNTCTKEQTIITLINILLKKEDEPRHLIFFKQPQWKKGLLNLCWHASF